MAINVDNGKIEKIMKQKENNLLLQVPKEILIFISIIYCLLLCSCEQTDTRSKTSDGRYTEYTGHPNLYHTGRYFDIVKLNDTTFLCVPNVSGKDVITIKISNHEIYERKD